MTIKFVSEDKIPAREGHGVKKYQDLYDALQKKPGAWAEITQAMKYTLSHRDGGKKTYPGVKTMKRGERFFASFHKADASPKHGPTGKSGRSGRTKTVTTKRAAMRKSGKRRGKK